MAPPHGRAEPIRHRCSTSGKTYLRKGKNVIQAEWEAAVLTPRSEKDGEEMLQVVKQRFPCSHLSEEDHARADIHTAACEGPHTRADGCFLKELQPMERPHWSMFILKHCSPQRGLALEQG